MRALFSLLTGRNPRILALSIILLPYLLHADYDRTATVNAIEAKQVELKWEREDLAKDAVRLAMLNAHLANAGPAQAKLDGVLAQLRTYKAELEAAHDQNKWKALLKLLIKTAESINNSVNVAKEGAAALINHGVQTAVKAVAWDQLKGAAEDELGQRIGLDIDALSTPQTRKVASCTALASTTMAELHGVQRAIGLSLDRVKAIMEAESGERITSDDAAVLRRNIIVRQQIDLAITAIEALKASSAEAAADLPAQIASLEAEMDATGLKAAAVAQELEELRRILKEEDAAANLAAAQAAIVAPVVLPKPSVSVPAEPASDYADRLAAAQREAVIAKWNNESPALINRIAEIKSGIEHQWTNMTGRYFDNVAPVDPESFIESNLGAAPIPQSVYGSFVEMTQMINDLTAELILTAEAVDEAKDLLDFCESMRVDFIELADTRNELVSLVDLVQSVPGAWSGLSYGESYDPPAVGSASEVEEYASLFASIIDLYPTAEGNAQGVLNSLIESYNALNSVAAFYATEVETEMGLAEGALLDMISVAKSYQSLLEANPEIAPKATLDNGALPFGGDHFYGYWTGFPWDSTGYHRVLDRRFVGLAYLKELASRMATDGFASAGPFKINCDVVALRAESLQDRYAEAWMRFSTALGQLELIADSAGLAFVANITAASHLSSGLGSLPNVSGHNSRFLQLRGTLNTTFSTSLDGNPPVMGEATATNHGLPALGGLPGIGFDEFEHELVVHRIYDHFLAIKVHGNTDWMTLPYAELLTVISERRADLGAITANMNSLVARDYASLFPPSELINAAYEAAARADWDLVMVLSQYTTKNTPSIASISSGRTVSPPAGSSAPVVLTVNARGTDLAYQWYSSIAGGVGYSNYTMVPGATGPSLETTIDSRRDFYCHVSNSFGSVSSDPIAIEFSPIANPLSWSGPTTQSAQVAVPLDWTLATSPAATMWEATGLPDGLRLDSGNGRLHGIPAQEGTFKVLIEARLGDRYVSRTITLDIAAAPPTEEVMETWLGEFFTPTEIADPAISDPEATPAGDDVPNILKFALGLDPTEPIDSSKLVTLSPTTEGGVELSFEMNRPAAALGLRAVLYEADSLFGPWVRVVDLNEDDSGDSIGVTFEMPKSADRFYKIVAAEAD